MAEEYEATCDFILQAIPRSQSTIVEARRLKHVEVHVILLE